MANRINNFFLYKCSQLLNYIASVRETTTLAVENSRTRRHKNLSNTEWPGINPGPPTWQEDVYPPEPLSVRALFTGMSFRLQLLRKEMTVHRRQKRPNSLIAGVVRISERFGNFPASHINRWLDHGSLEKTHLTTLEGEKKTLWTRKTANWRLLLSSLWIMYEQTLRNIEKLRLGVFYVTFPLIFTRPKL